MAAFVDEFGVGDFEQMGDTTARVWRFFNVTAQPTYVFINDNGALEVTTGALDIDELSQRLEVLANT